MFEFIFRNSNALIANTEIDFVIPQRTIDVNGPVLRGVFAGIRNKIEKNVAQDPAVGFNSIQVVTKSHFDVLATFERGF